MLDHYVVGFMFSKDRERVVLIEKKRSHWQAGLFNGPGGHIERGEALFRAMTREFNEEAGMYVPEAKWQEVAIVNCPSTRVHFFRSFCDLGGVRCYGESLTDEPIRVFRMDRLPPMEEIVWPSGWLLRACLDDDLIFPLKISYATDGRCR